MALGHSPEIPSSHYLVFFLVYKHIEHVYTRELHIFVLITLIELLLSSTYRTHTLSIV